MAKLAAHTDWLSSSREHRAAIYIEDFPGDEARQGSAKEEDGRRDLFGSGDPPKRYFAENFFCSCRIIERWSRHIGIHPTRSNTVHIDMMRRKLGGETFDHTDDRAFGRRVIGMKCFAPLPGSGADQHYVRQRV